MPEPLDCWSDPVTLNLSPASYPFRGYEKGYLGFRVR